MHPSADTGRVIAGRYRLQSPIGRGAMGVVWRARDQLLDRDVAIKEVQIADTLTEAERATAFQRTLREAKTAARLNHPAVVTVYDVAEDGGRPWIVMQLVHAQSLDQVLGDSGPLSPRRAAEMARQLLSALSVAHAAGVLHRDVKPSNVLIGSDDRAVLTDFGIATFADDPKLTQTGMVMGSPGFTAPERIRGEDASPASDLWSLGATVYAAVEGHGPFEQRGGAITTMSAIINEDAPGAPAAGALGPVIAALLRREPAGRPDAGEAARMITSVLPLLADRAPGSPPGYEATALSASPRPAAPQPGSAQPGYAPAQPGSPGSAQPGSGWSGSVPSKSVPPRPPQPTETSLDYASAEQTEWWEQPSSSAVTEAGEADQPLPSQVPTVPQPILSGTVEHDQTRGLQSQGGYSPRSTTASAPDSSSSYPSGSRPEPVSQPSPRAQSGPASIARRWLRALVGSRRSVSPELRRGSTPPDKPPAPPAAIPRLESDPPRRWLKADMPAAVPLGTDVSLLVRITTSASSGGGGTVLLKAFKIGADETRVAVIVQAPRGLSPTEPLEQLLVVPADGDSTPVRFAFRAERPGLFTIRVTAFVGGTFLGEFTAELSVEAGGRLTEGPTRIAAIAPVQPEPGEVTLQVRFDGEQYTFQLLSESYLFEPVFARALTAKPGEAVERTVAMLRAMATERSGYTPRNARAWMERTGIGLWNDMVPDLIKEQFWQLRSSIGAFTIACGQDTIPWELLYPLSETQDAGFLVEQFPVLRRAYGQRRSRRLSVAPPLYVIPPGSPTNARQEVEALRRRLAASSEEICDLEPLLELVEAGSAGLLHFACHNTFKAEVGGSSIMMGGGPFVPGLLNRAVTTHSLAQRSPLVFINGCRSAGAIPEYTSLMGWAGQFMSAGAGAFIGTLWAVRSDSALAFAEAFYDALLTGQTLGLAVRTARLATAADSDPTWLAYTVYGDPTATMNIAPGVFAKAT